MHYSDFFLFTNQFVRGYVNKLLLSRLVTNKPQIDYIIAESDEVSIDINNNNRNIKKETFSFCETVYVAIHACISMTNHIHTKNTQNNE